MTQIQIIKQEFHLPIFSAAHLLNFCFFSPPHLLSFSTSIFSPLPTSAFRLPTSKNSHFRIPTSYFQFQSPLDSQHQTVQAAADPQKPHQVPGS